MLTKFEEEKYLKYHNMFKNRIITEIQWKKFAMTYFDKLLDYNKEVFIRMKNRT